MLKTVHIVIMLISILLISGCAEKLSNQSSNRFIPEPVARPTKYYKTPVDINETAVESVEIGNVNQGVTPEQNPIVKSSTKEQIIKKTIYDGGPELLELENTPLEVGFAGVIQNEVRWFITESFVDLMIDGKVYEDTFEGEILTLKDGFLYLSIAGNCEATCPYNSVIEVYFTKNFTLLENFTNERYFCYSDDECVKVPSTNCECNSFERHDIAVTKKYEDEVFRSERETGYPMNCSYGDKKGGSHWTCTATPKCINHRCKLVKTE